MTFKKWIGRGLSSRSKISLGSPTISKILSSTSIKTSWPAHTLTPPKDICIGAYYLIGPTILGKLACSNKKNKRASDFYFFLKREIKVWRMNGMPNLFPVCVWIRNVAKGLVINNVCREIQSTNIRKYLSCCSSSYCFSRHFVNLLCCKSSKHFSAVFKKFKFSLLV
jgi:hypothetical protein